MYVLKITGTPKETQSVPYIKDGVATAESQTG